MSAPPAPLPLQVGIGIMRSQLQHGTCCDMKQLFQAGYPGHNWIIGPDQLHARFLTCGPNRLPMEADARRWQPLVPLLIRSFQLTRDILIALPLGDHMALEKELYLTGLRKTLKLLVHIKGGTVWRFRCGLEAMKLALDPEGAVQRIRNLRDSTELPLLTSAIHCMHSSIGKYAVWG